MGTIAVTIGAVELLNSERRWIGSLTIDGVRRRRGWPGRTDWQKLVVGSSIRSPGGRSYRVTLCFVSEHPSSVLFDQLQATTTERRQLESTELESTERGWLSERLRHTRRRCWLSWEELADDEADDHTTRRQTCKATALLTCAEGSVAILRVLRRRRCNKHAYIIGSTFTSC